MKATFFIIPDSFKYNGDTQINIENKIKNFAIDLRRIKEVSGNEIFCHPDAYSTEIFEDKTITDVLYNPSVTLLDRDVIQQLRIIWELKETNHSIDYICEVYLPSHNENECYGLIAFNNVNNVLPEYQLVYGIDSWFKFKRHFLGIYPKDVNFFIDECKLYYESLFFHDNNKTTIRRLFPNSVKRIIHHLTELNDKFPRSKTNPYNRLDSLRNFNVEYNHDGQEASPEGDIRKKKSLTFTFTNINGEKEDIYCELHLKISYDDARVFSNDRRIYFHEGIEEVENGKILIGHIGKHL